MRQHSPRGNQDATKNRRDSPTGVN
jgi:hypothetical protein